MATHQFRLPDLGEGLEDAELVRWLVEEGASVDLNQPLVEVDTAKALVEIPSPVAGKVSKQHAIAGSTVKVGAVLVTFETEALDEVDGPKRTAVLVGYGPDTNEGAVVSRRRRLSGVRGPGRSGRKEAAPGQAVAGSETLTEAVGSVPTGNVLVTPPVRKLAQELGVDLAALKGSGPEGRITRVDVHLSASSKDSASGPADVERRIPVKGVRKLIAEKMTLSVSEIPHVTTFLSVDATALMQLRSSLVSDRKITPLAVIARAFIAVCEQYPKLNATFDADAGEIVLKASVHLGIATDTDRGLLVPVIKDAHSLSVPDLASEIIRLAGAARSGKVKPEEVAGSTVTISNVGSFGAEFGTPIINYPESSILAVGVIEERAVVIEGDVQVRPMVTLSLSFDHRVMDGAEAGRGLLHLKNLLEDAEALSKLG